MSRTRTPVLSLAALVLSMPAEGSDESLAPSRDDQEVVTLPCDWPVGMTFQYIYEERVRTGADATSEQAVRVPVTVTVTASGNPATFDFTMGTPDFDMPPAALAQAQASRVTTMPTLQLVMTDGVLTGIGNHLAVVDAVAPTIREQTMDHPEVAERILAMFRDPVAGPRLLLKEPNQLFGLHCSSMAPGQVFEGPTTLPNATGGDPLPAISRLELAAHDPVAETVTFEASDLLAPEAIGIAMDGTLERIAPAAAALQAEVRRNLPPIDMALHWHTVYSTADGFPLQLVYREELRSQEQALVRLTTHTWTRIDLE